ncbi:MAG TPA: prolipoprotein diacylglyceryl transferase family protein [Acidimicrobiia bacterium]|nr:prolipoprotein diacylglyceryl transferase family protein [Acidimicrobiia bacterium]
MEFTLLWASLTAVASIWVGTRLWPRGLPDHSSDRMVGAAAVGLLGGRLAAMLIQGTSPLANPGDILIVRGGVHTATATLGAIIAYLWSVRGEIGYLDAVAPAAALGLAGWHGGCLWRSACLGTASDLPWAWADPGSLVTRHPVELYAALGLAVAAWGISRLPFRPLFRSGIALASVAMIRLITEPLRLSLGGGPWGWYLAGVVIGLMAATLGSRALANRIPAGT